MPKMAIWTATVMLLGLATPAFPCSVVTLFTPAELVERAQVIVRAKSEGAVSSPGASDKILAKTLGQVRFRVLEVLKGTFVGDALVFNGLLEQKDDWNDRSVPYNFVRPGGRHGNCYALAYLVGAEYLLFLQQSGAPSEGSMAWSPYWAALAPTNEQLRGPGDKWLQWVTRQVRRKPGA